MMSICRKSNKLIKSGNKSLGFTLIEMMLIVLLLAFIVLQVAQTQQQKAEANIVERAAGDMNDWALALINYYNQNGTWPQLLKSLTLAPPPYAKAMMPLTTLCSQFAVNTGTNPDCGSYAEYTGQNNDTYYVLSIQTTSQNVAALLAAKLQNSWVNKQTVYTAIPAPNSATFATASTRRGWIVSAGLVTFAGYTGAGYDSSIHSVGTQIYLPNCPAGYEGHLITTPEQYQTYGNSQSQAVTWGIHLAETKQDGTNGDTSANDSSSVVFKSGTDHYKNTAYAITTNDVPDTVYVANSDPKASPSDLGTTRHLGFYMTFCLPQVLNSSGTFVSSNWYTNYINDDWLQDGQCSNSWQTYLELQGNTSPTCPYTNNGDLNGSQFKNIVIGQPTGY